MVLALRLGLLLALLMPWAASAVGQTTVPKLTFVSASGNKAKGPDAVDGDRSTTWLGIARREPAWITFKIEGATPLIGIVVTMAKMPANTYYHVDLSADGQTFEPVLQNLQNETDKATVRPFGTVREARYLRLRFENGSRQPMVPFALHEVSALPAGSLPDAASLSNHTVPLVVAQTPAPAPSPRILGTVMGRWEGDRVLVVVGDGFPEGVESVKVDDWRLPVLQATNTQILCRYPYGRLSRVTVVVKAGGRTITRRVPMVQREVRWPKP